MDKHLQYSIDQLMMEQGEYTPLELLLAEGRLSYHDYEAWRCGDINRLDTTLFGDPDQIQHMLTEAEDYVRSLGLQAETFNYQRWGGRSESALRFSDNNALNSRFHTHYRKSKADPQMDLFMDAPGTALANGITQALMNRDYGKARQLLERLYDTEPGHTRLGSLEQLVEAETRLAAPVTDATSELDELCNTLVPTANDVLGRNARSVLTPYWQRLDAALRDHRFNPRTPQLHSSYAAAQALDWEGVKNAVEKEADWRQYPTLLLRHAIACTRLQQRAAALLSWFELCWRYPDDAENLATDADHELQLAWHKFGELEPELNTEDFPAWLLLQQRVLIKTLPEPQQENTPNGSYIITYRLQQHALVQTNSAETGDIELRAQLKHANPALFEHFLRNRQRG